MLNLFQHLFKCVVARGLRVKPAMTHCDKEVFRSTHNSFIPFAFVFSGFGIIIFFFCVLRNRLSHGAGLADEKN